MLTCPICENALAVEDRTLRCALGHAFDRAREGYVDLLPVGHGRSGITGDTRAMARARQRFLERGHYRPLVERIVARVRDHLEPLTADGSERLSIAESGCGTGHYIGALAAALPGADPYGFDVSREALRIAARAHSRVTFAVNDVTHRLCVPDHSVAALLDVFAPRNAAEFVRVLRPDGLLVVVIPGEGHLAELRDSYPLLEIEPEKRARTLGQLAPAFRPAWEETLAATAELTADAVGDLLGMTPSAFHLPERDPPAPRAMTVTLDFTMLGLIPHTLEQ